MNIRKFKIGDTIVRVEKAEIKEIYTNEDLGVTMERVKYQDGSYVGEPMELLDICNGQIYLRKKGKKALIFENDLLSLYAKDWGEGWQKFKLPKGVKEEEIFATKENS